MTDYADLKAQIADYANRLDWPDALVAGFISQAEQKFNQELRVGRMIETYITTLTEACAPLPDDWLEMDLVKIANANAADGFLPIRYKPRDEFFNLTSKHSYGFYTIEGREILFGGAPDPVNGIVYKIYYFAEVPVFSDTNPSWLYTKYPSLYLYGSLMHANLHAVGEEPNAANMKSLTEDMIAKLNIEYLRAKASGSRITRSRARSFG